MPLKGRQRTERQKAQTAAMQKRRRSPKPHAKTEAVDPVNRRLLSQEHEKHRREMEKVKKSEYNSRRRERRMQKKSEASQAQIQEAVDVVGARYESQLEELRGETEALKKEVVRLNACVDREPSKIQNAAQNILDHGRGIQQYAEPTRQAVEDN